MGWTGCNRQRCSCLDKTQCVKLRLQFRLHLTLIMISALVPDLSLTQDEVELSYAITLAEHQLATDIHVTNKSTSTPLEFQALLHTYIRAPAANVVVDGLSGVTYTDKTQQGAKVVESRALVDVKKFTDSVYENGPGEYTVTWPDGGLKVRAIGFKDVVVWNPNAEAGSKMNDMEVGGWSDSKLSFQALNRLIDFLY